MKIAIVHNLVRDNSLPDEQDVLKQVEAVAATLVNLGHDACFIPCDLNLNDLKQKLEKIKPDMVFNLSESLDGHGRLIHVVPALLDALQIPYTGASAEAIYHTSHKVMAKERMRAAGLPTPDWINPFPYDLPWVRDIRSKEKETAQAESTDTESSQKSTQGKNQIWIIKSLWEHASFGIDENNVVTGTRKKIAQLLKEKAPLLGGACFAEAFIDGREFNISMLGDGETVHVMPPAEIIFKDYPNATFTNTNDTLIDGSLINGTFTNDTLIDSSLTIKTLKETLKKTPKIVGYKAKWIEDAPEYHNTPRSFDFPQENLELLNLLEKLSIRCWHLFNLRGYARVDFRVGNNQQPMILEINANPCISPDAGFAAALEKGGFSYDDAIEKILNFSRWAK